MSAPFPWQTDAWSMLCGAREAAKLGHAWVLCGRAGTGKSLFAQRFAQLALCEGATAVLSPCGDCRSCHLFRAGNHPDFRRVAPLDDARSIGIDQVRELGDFFALTTHYGKAKLALFQPADALTKAAANALLKLLEEPPALGLFVLVTDQLERLPPTIRSRCQRLTLDRINPAQGLNWLQSESPTTASSALALAYRLNRHAPLATLAALTTDDLELAAKVETHMLGVASGRVHAVQAAQAMGDVLPARLADLMLDNAHQLNLQLHNAVTSAGEGALDQPYSSAGLNSLINQLNSRQVFEFITCALEVKAMSGPTANFRQGDLLDLLWQAWMKATRTHHRHATQTI